MPTDTLAPPPPSALPGEDKRTSTLRLQAAGYGVQDTAKILHLNPGTISRWRNGKSGKKALIQNILPQNGNKQLEPVTAPAPASPADALILDLVPAALGIWRAALGGREIDASQRQIAERVLRKAGLLQETTTDDRSVYDGMMTAELIARITAILHIEGIVEKSENGCLTTTTPEPATQPVVVYPPGSKWSLVQSPPRPFIRDQSQAAQELEHKTQDTSNADEAMPTVPAQATENSKGPQLK